MFVAFRSIRLVEAYWGRFSIRTETELGDNLYLWVALLEQQFNFDSKGLKK